jgi:hypothetical protein
MERYGLPDYVRLSALIPDVGGRAGIVYHPPTDESFSVGIGGAEALLLAAQGGAARTEAAPWAEILGAAKALGITTHGKTRVDLEAEVAEAQAKLDAESAEAILTGG